MDLRHRAGVSTLALLTTVVSVVVLLAPPASAATTEVFHPGNFKRLFYAARIDSPARGKVIQISPTTSPRTQVSMIAVKSLDSERTTPKLDRWVRANHGRKARMCVMLRGRVQGVNGAIAVNRLHRGTQKDGWGAKQESFYAGSGWRRHCLNFTVIGRAYYQGNADLLVYNYERDATHDIFVDWVSLKLL